MPGTAENWDLTVDEHLARARALLSRKPMAGQLMMFVQQDTLMADRHVTWARLKMAEQEASR